MDYLTRMKKGLELQNKIVKALGVPYSKNNPQNYIIPKVCCICGIEKENLNLKFLSKIEKAEYYRRPDLWRGDPGKIIKREATYIEIFICDQCLLEIYYKKHLFLKKMKLILIPLIVLVFPIAIWINIYISIVFYISFIVIGFFSYYISKTKFDKIENHIDIDISGQFIKMTNERFRKKFLILNKDKIGDKEF